MKFLPQSALAKSAGWMFLGQGFGYCLRVVYFIVIARLLGVLQYGIVVGAFALVNLVAEHGRLGTGVVLLRHVSPNREKFASYWANTLTVTAVMSGLLIVILGAVAPHVIDPASAGIVIATAIGSCLFEQVTMSATQAFQAIEEMKMAALFNAMTATLRTAVAVGMLLVLHHASARQWAIASAIASAMGAVLAVTAVTKRLGWPQFSPHLAWKHGLEGAEYAFASSTASAYNDLDKTMLSHYGMSAANGIYGMAYRVVEMATAPLAAIQLAAQPRLFKLGATGRGEAVTLGRRLLKHSLGLSMLTACGMFLSAPLIPLFAGSGFRDGVGALRWLCLIPVFRSVHWTTGGVLTAAGLQRFRTLMQIFAVLLNLGLNIWLIPRHGWHGAAWASLVTDGALGAMNWGTVEWKLGGTANGKVKIERDQKKWVAPEPLVSIVIAAYNQDSFVLQAVLSAKQQTYSNVEVIVVDDGSAVPVHDAIGKLSGVQILRTQNRGVSATRNLGFRHSSGEYVIFLDGDDKLVPGAIEAHLAAFSNHPEAALSFGSVRLIDKAGALIKAAHICRPRKDYSLMFLECNPIACPGAAMHSRHILVANGLFKESLSICEDYDLYLRITRSSAVIQHSTCVVEYRQHNNNVSSSKQRMLEGTLAVLDEIEPSLSIPERRRLRHARTRWRHAFKHESTVIYKLRAIYFGLRAMQTLPILSYFRR